MLVDHNVPEGIFLKIKKFASSIFEEVICGFQERKFNPDGQIIYEKLVSSFLEFISVFSAYQNSEFSEIQEFETNLLKKIIKSGKLGGYTSLVVNAVQTNSELKQDLLKAFESDLATFVDIPSKSKITEPMETETEISNESIVSTLHSLYAELCKQNKRLEKLSNKLVWEFSESDKELKKLLLVEAGNLTGSSIKVASSKLSSLPIEDLPYSYKFATTILALYSLFEEESNQSFVLVTRCLESFDIFKNLNSSNLLNKILSLQTETPEFFLNRLSLSLNCPKTITEIKDNFKTFEEKIQGKVTNYLHFFTVFLEKISAKSPDDTKLPAINTELSSLIVKVIL